jgi:hypothetical protein
MFVNLLANMFARHEFLSPRRSSMAGIMIAKQDEFSIKDNKQ